MFEIFFLISKYLKKNEMEVLRSAKNGRKKKLCKNEGRKEMFYLTMRSTHYLRFYA